MFNSLLTLDESTLFFWTLSDSSSSNKRKSEGEEINNWAAKVPRNAAPSSHTRSNATVPSISRRSVPSLTSGTSRSHSSRSSKAHSSRTDNVKIANRDTVDLVSAQAAAKTIAVTSDGGLLDNDEINGEEWLAAVNSPLKGKKRVTSDVSPLWVMCWVVIIITDTAIQQLIVQKPEETKKPRYEELPEHIEPKWFRQTFVSTYMVFVGQTADPWDVPVKRAVEVMQKIWDSTTSRTYKITCSGPVYQKVRTWFCSWQY